MRFITGCLQTVQNWKTIPLLLGSADLFYRSRPFPKVPLVVNIPLPSRLEGTNPPLLSETGGFLRPANDWSVEVSRPC